MAALEAEGWDPPTARAALRAADGNARKVLAAGREGWMGSGYCSGCYENHTSGRHCGCACHTEGKTDTQAVPITVQAHARPAAHGGSGIDDPREPVGGKAYDNAACTAPTILSTSLQTRRSTASSPRGTGAGVMSKHANTDIARSFATVLLRTPTTPLSR